MGKHLCFTVADRSYFAILKKEIHGIAVKAGFNATKVGEVDIIVAEMVSNLVKHGGGGRLLVKLIVQQHIEGIEFISIDDGNGIGDVNKMMADGASTTNTLGHGLGAIRRLSNLFQVYSQKGWGTVMLSRLFKEDLPYQKKINEIRSVVVPKPGEEECGDAFHCRIGSHAIRLFLGDGLGHGVEAAAAVNGAIQVFKTLREDSAVEIIREMHRGVRKTRGLVGTVALYLKDEKRWRICGVGNISTRLINGIEMKNNMAYNGIIGHNIPNSMKDQEVDAVNAQVILLCSDGIRTKWDLAKYPGILKHDLSILAGVIFKDHARHTDDMSVVAVRLNY
jgi:anti-sigma regulatory factor (Ser/Thr protein kinase)